MGWPRDENCCLRRMIYGIGTDICDIERIHLALQRWGGRFAGKILCDAEMAIWRARAAAMHTRGVSYVATRFAAKEAFSKAVGLGMRSPMGWRLCEVAQEPSGKPCVVLHGALKEWFEARDLRAHLSMSDEVRYACAFVVVQSTASTI